MTANRNENRYEGLYSQLLERGEQLHESNKRRIRRGLIALVVLPFVLGFILWMTESDKIVFLIIWIIIMFALSVWAAQFLSGCSAVWLAHLLWEQRVAGSNPVTPTRKKRVQWGPFSFCL